MGNRGFSVLIALAALVSSGLVVPAGAASPGLDHASFTYGLGSQAAGEIRGTCEGQALAFTPGTPGGTRLAPGRGALLVVYDYWVNSTLLLPESGSPIGRTLGSESRKAEVVLDPRGITIDWPDAGMATVFGPGARATKDPTFPASFSAQALSVGPAGLPSSHKMDVGASPPEGLAAIGLSRAVSAESGEFVATGDLSVYLRQARVSDGFETAQLGPYHEVENSGTPGAQVVSEHYRWAWLEMGDATLRARGSEATLYCLGLSASVEGSFTAFAASGHLGAQEAERAFERQELTLVGGLNLRETVAAPGASDQSLRTEADVSGRFDAAGIDFAVAQRADTHWPAAATAAGGIVLVALAGFFLYSRIAEDRVLDRPERRRLLDAVTANPGIEFSRLLEQNPMSATNARYHLKLLERRGLLRVVNVQGRHRFVPAGQDATRARQDLLLSEDPKLRNLLELLDGSGRPASELVDALRREWGLSRTGGWKVLDRALRAQLVERLVVERRVILRRAP